MAVTAGDHATEHGGGDLGAAAAGGAGLGVSCHDDQAPLGDSNRKEEARMVAASRPKDNFGYGVPQSLTEI